MYNLFQDKKGYIWIFSKYGTLKYDGTEFKPVLRNLPFKDSFIFSIYERKDGRMWVANSNARIYEIGNDSAFMIGGIENISTSLRNSVSEIFKLFVDDSLNIYALTKSHSYKLIKKSSVYNPVELCGELASDCVWIKVLDMGSELLPIVSHVKREQYDTLCGNKRTYVQLATKKSKQLVVVHGNYLKASVKSIKKYDRDIYFGIRNVLYKVGENGNIKTIDFNDVVLTLKKDKYEHTWLGCLNDGLYELNENDSIVNHYFKGLTINDVLIDEQNGLWVTTPGNGLFHCENISARFIDTVAKDNGLKFITQIDNNLFVANTKGGAFTINNGRVQQIRKEDNNAITSIVKNGEFYYLSLLYSWEKMSFNYKKRTELSKIQDLPVYNFHVKSKDTMIYVCRKSLIFVVNESQKKIIDFDKRIYTSVLFSNNLWLSTIDGVFGYKPVFFKAGVRSTILIPDKGTLIEKPLLNGLKDNIVVKFVKDPGENMWFCTHGGGLYSLIDNKLENYDSGSGLPSDMINNLTFNSDSSIFLSTSKGLFYARSWNDAFIRYSWESVYDGEVQNAILFEGKIYIHSLKGLVAINYNDLKQSYRTYFFNLGAITVGATEFGKTYFSKIKSQTGPVEFKYDLIGPSDNGVKIKYLLTGPIIDSGVTVRKSVKFNLLPPGEYKLVTYPLINKGEALKMTTFFEVTPLFTETTLFKIVLALVFVSVIILLVRGFERYKQRNQLAEQKNEQLISEYKLIALKAQINPHFISNCLSAIQLLVHSKNNHKANLYIAKFGYLVRQILEVSSKQFISLADELELLSVYIELEQLRFEDKFIYETKIQNDINPKHIFVPSLLLNPIVENAIWHGLLPIHSLRQCKLSIKVWRKKENLIISIEDNGAGRQQDKISVYANSNSHGHKITEQRLSSINYLNKNVETKMVYEDLRDSENNPCGTLVTLYLPYNLATINNEET